MREISEFNQKTIEAIEAYNKNKEVNKGLHFKTLQSFAEVFNPIATTLWECEMPDELFEQLQPIAMELFDYGDSHWTGKVYESGVYPK